MLGCLCKFEDLFVYKHFSLEYCPILFSVGVGAYIILLHLKCMFEISTQSRICCSKIYTAQCTAICLILFFKCILFISVIRKVKTTLPIRLTTGPLPNHPQISKYNQRQGLAIGLLWTILVLQPNQSALTIGQGVPEMEPLQLNPPMDQRLLLLQLNKSETKGNVVLACRLA